MARVVPVKDSHSVILCWPLPEQTSTYCTQSSGYLSHLFGYEGKGSILSLLKVCVCVRVFSVCQYEGECVLVRGVQCFVCVRKLFSSSSCLILFACGPYAPLQKRGWALELSGGCSTQESGFAFFTVDVEVTPEGLSHVDDIISIVYQYTRMLRERGPSVRASVFTVSVSVCVCGDLCDWAVLCCSVAAIGHRCGIDYMLKSPSSMALCRFS